MIRVREDKIIRRELAYDFETPALLRAGKDCIETVGTLKTDSSRFNHVKSTTFIRIKIVEGKNGSVRQIDPSLLTLYNPGTSRWDIEWQNKKQMWFRSDHAPA